MELQAKARLLTAKYSDQQLLKIAHTAGTSMYGKSGSGLLLGKKVERIPFATFADNEEGPPTFDTFQFVFKPSTGKGMEAADSRVGNGQKWADTDGLIYVAGPDGVLVLSPPFEKTKKAPVDRTAEKASFAKELDQFKAAVAKAYPGVKFKIKTETYNSRGSSGYNIYAILPGDKWVGEFYATVGGREARRPRWIVKDAKGKPVAESVKAAFMGMTEDTEGQVATPSRKDTQEPAEGMGTDLGACYRLMDTVPHGLIQGSPEQHDWYDDRTPEERAEDTHPDNDWYDDGTASNDERRRHGLPAIPGR